jgi:hypothetical protein
MVAVVLEGRRWSFLLMERSGFQIGLPGWLGFELGIFSRAFHFFANLLLSVVKSS